MTPQSLHSLLEKFHGARVLVVGDVMLDRFVYGSVERISPEAPIPVLNVERTLDMVGGAANVARNIAELGAECILVGCTGDDVWAEDVRVQLAKIPSISPHLIVDAGRPTTVKTRHIADGQQILRADVEARHALPTAVAERVVDHIRTSIEQVDVMILSDYAKGVLSDSVVAAAIAHARAAGKPVLVDPKSKSFSRYRGATILTPNRGELHLACGMECATDDQVVAAARSILASDVCDALVVTRGKDGMSIVERDATATHLRTVAREVFDVSGAGDTVMAALAIGIACGGGIHDAARLANLAAGIVVGKYGTAVVTAGEIVASLGDHERGDGMASKNFTQERVLDMVQAWRSSGLRVAFTNGCFDLLHPGHVSLLNQARAAADRLVVALNSDLSVRQLKGPGRPVQSEVARATVLASLKAVDAVVIFDEPTPLRLIGLLEPDVLVKGADYTVETVVGADLVTARGGAVLLAQLVPAQSTTRTVEKIARAGKS